MPTSNSGTFAVAPGPDGATWFAEKTAAKLGRITSGGTITEFNIPTPVGGLGAPQVIGITTGPDGALWFANESSYAGRLTTSGAFSWILLSSATVGVASGPDGNLWFTEVNRGIARVTPTGGVVEFPAPPSGHDPELITAGPDGAMWFSEDADQIGRVTMSGRYTEYPLPHPSSHECVAAGPDGKVWIAEQGYLAEVSSSGAVVEQAVPGPALGACIAVGKDRSMWFSTATGIGRMTMGGDVTTYRSPSGSGSSYISLGADGRIWTSESGAAVVRWANADRNVDSVLELASGFAPSQARQPPGRTIRWTAINGDGLDVVDAAGMIAASSTATPPGSSVDALLSAASSYVFDDPRHTGRESRVQVSPTVTPAAGSTATAFTVTWASSTPMAETGEDVQVAWCAGIPCAGSFGTWLSGSAGTQATFDSSNANWHGAGIYEIRARLRRNDGTAVQGWSPAIRVTVSS